MKPVKVSVKDGSQNIFYFKRNLKRLGLYENDDRFSGTFRSKKKIEKIKNFCKDNHIKFFYDNEYGERSSNYRQKYFINNKSIDGKYRCVYCGRRFNKNDITIDHLYPVSKVSKNLKLQKKLKKKGINSLNSAENLVAACWKCNSRKKDKMGIWIFRGKIGKSEALWEFRWAIRIILIMLIFSYLFLCFVPEYAPEFIKSYLIPFKQIFEDVSKSGIF